MHRASGLADELTRLVSRLVEASTPNAPALVAQRSAPQLYPAHAHTSYPSMHASAYLRYVDRPMLLPCGHKLDLRLYVLLVPTQPPAAFLHTSGGVEQGHIWCTPTPCTLHAVHC